MKESGYLLLKHQLSSLKLSPFLTTAYVKLNCSEHGTVAWMICTIVVRYLLHCYTDLINTYLWMNFFVYAHKQNCLIQIVFKC